MKKLLLIAVACLMGSEIIAQESYETLFEKSQGLKTPSYKEVIEYFELLAKDFEQVKMVEMGVTDAGLPLHVVIYDAKGEFDPVIWHDNDRLVVYINNAIHPGEPDGIDASMMFLRDILLGKKSFPDNAVLAITPVYNIGGHLNRGSHSRVNQNGPEEFGFRGNARNYDLNRDFIKADTKNARSFHQIFNWMKPHVFIDTHVSNGADYQHVMTLISTQHDRLGGQLGAYLEKSFNPELYSKMKDRDFPMIPYVNAYGSKPEDGWPQFKDIGRYSSGYAALFKTLSFMPETHMLKPYDQRVASTYALFEVFVDMFERDGEKIVSMSKADREAVKQQSVFELNHKSDRSKFKLMEFHGYESGQKPSEISGHPRLYYDRQKPFSTEIKFYDAYESGLTIAKPKAYIIPQGWHTVIDNLRRNGVQVQPLQQDSSMVVTVYQIKDFQTSQRPYEGHFMHSNVSVEKSSETITFRKGDVVVMMDQEANNFIIEVLEPEGEDSFFAWNYFDMILQSKEGYSAYVFEDLAAAFLKENPSLRDELERAKQEDEKLASNGSAQLRWVYERSPWKEKEHNRYPVYRVEN
ncbi:M14 family metallopeptidase [Belliella kenyensis]|uniref:M14 family metallopeptidase n=1 Tax=Belliella kenyensis TaxID=1472724 RepID=A0ABV8ELM9_9BACT|nr:M14 family metallopeptidase [Belliella kenyensis]MCH7401384.1 M14 family metallopeptidase [Belliella kenyensis]MDN3602827.1 M14 family metallopeptidase [Belliella kenyensis]